MTYVIISLPLPICSDGNKKTDSAEREAMKQKGSHKTWTLTIKFLFLKKKGRNLKKKKEKKIVGGGGCFRFLFKAWIEQVFPFSSLFFWLHQKLLFMNEIQLKMVTIGRIIIRDGERLRNSWLVWTANMWIETSGLDG